MVALRVELLPSLAGAREVWSALAEASGNVFSTWEWTSTWWRHFGRGRLVLGACRDEGSDLAAILPLYQSGRQPLRLMRFVGHGPADQLGPVVAPSRLPSAIGALDRLVREIEVGWDLFLGEDLPAFADWHTLTGARTLYRTASPVLELSGRDWSGFLDERSRGFREQLRRQERRLARDYAVHYRVVHRAEELQPALAILLALHEARWRSVLTTRSFAGPLACFHRDFAAQALDRGWLRLYVLELDGQPAAALYNLRFAGSESYYQAGRDPRYARWSVGFLLQCRAIADAIEDGVREYRLLRGKEPYKYRFAEADRGVVTVGVAGSARGRAAIAASTLRRRIRRRARDVRGLPTEDMTSALPDTFPV